MGQDVGGQPLDEVVEVDAALDLSPTDATAFDGTTTSGLTDISTFACHASTVIVPTLPTMTSLIITGEFDSSVATFGTSTVYFTESGPRPTAPGSGSEFTP